jgi:hypothetical protein
VTAAEDSKTPPPPSNDDLLQQAIKRIEKSHKEAKARKVLFKAPTFVKLCKGNNKSPYLATLLSLADSPSSSDQVKTHALKDSGATHTMVSAALAKRLPGFKAQILTPTSLKMSTAIEGQSQSIQGSLTIHITMMDVDQQPFSVKHEVLVVNGLSDEFIIGEDMLQLYSQADMGTHVMLTETKRSMEKLAEEGVTIAQLQSSCAVVPVMQLTPSEASITLRSSKTCVIHPHEQVSIELKPDSRKTLSLWRGKTVMISPETRLFKNLESFHAHTKLKQSKSVPVFFTNTSSEPIVVRAGTPLAEVTVLPVASCNRVNFSEEKLEDYWNISISAKARALNKRLSDSSLSDTDERNCIARAAFTTEGACSGPDDKVHGVQPHPDADSWPSQEEIARSIDLSHLDNEEKIQSAMRRALLAGKEAFQRHPDHHTKTHLTKATAKLKPTFKPAVQKARPVPEHLKEEVTACLDRMVACGLIEEADVTPTFLSTLTFAPKKDKSIRICLDLRMLNNAAERIPCEQISAEEVQNFYSRNPFTSNCDIANAYHSIPLSSESKNHFGFTVMGRVMRYKVAAMGYSNSSYFLNDALRRALGDMERVLFYADDVAIGGRTAEEHIQLVAEVLIRLADAGFLVKPKKCTFLTSRVEFLGVVYNRKSHDDNLTMSIPDYKIKEFNNLPPPTTIRQAKRNLLKIAFYRRFIPRWAALTYNLHIHTLGPKGRCQWNEQLQRDFDNLRKVVVANRTLQGPDSSRPFHCYVTADAVSANVDVMQRDNSGVLQRVFHSSRLLKAAELNAPKPQRTILALLNGLKSHDYFLAHGEVYVYMDVSAIAHLAYTNQTTPNLRRRADTMRMYGCSVLHVHPARDKEDEQAAKAIGEGKFQFLCDPDEDVNMSSSEVEEWLSLANGHRQQKPAAKPAPTPAMVKEKEEKRKHNRATAKQSLKNVSSSVSNPLAAASESAEQAAAAKSSRPLPPSSMKNPKYWKSYVSTSLFTLEDTDPDVKPSAFSRRSLAVIPSKVRLEMEVKRKFHNIKRMMELKVMTVREFEAANAWIQDIERKRVKANKAAIEEEDDPIMCCETREEGFDCEHDLTSSSWAALWGNAGNKSDTDTAIRLCQSKDKWCVQTADAVKRRSLAGAAFENQNGKLMYMDVMTKESKTALPWAILKQYAASHHYDFNGKHSGPSEIAKAMSKSFYRPDMESDVAKIFKSCPLCTGTVVEEGYDLTEEPRTVYRMGVLYPSKPSAEGHKAIAVIKDDFTGFARFYPIKEATSTELIECVKDIFRADGREPKQIITEKNTQFMSDSFEQFLMYNGIEQRWSDDTLTGKDFFLSTRWPIHRIVRTLVKLSGNKWHEHLHILTNVISRAVPNGSNVPELSKEADELTAHSKHFSGITSTTSGEFPIDPPIVGTILSADLHLAKMARKKGKVTRDDEEEEEDAIDVSEFKVGDFVYYKNNHERDPEVHYPLDSSGDRFHYIESIRRDDQTCVLVSQFNGAKTTELLSVLNKQSKLKNKQGRSNAYFHDD